MLWTWSVQIALSHWERNLGRGWKKRFTSWHSKTNTSCETLWESPLTFPAGLSWARALPFWKSSKDEREKDRWSDLSPATFCSQFPMMTSWPSLYPALSCQISVCPIHQWCSIMRTHQSIKTFELVHCKLAGLLLKSIMTCGQYPNSNLVCNWILLSTV